MKYVKPELMIEKISPKQNIASGMEGWIEDEGLGDAKVTMFFVSES